MLLLEETVYQLNVLGIVHGIIVTVIQVVITQAWVGFLVMHLT